MTIAAATPVPLAGGKVVGGASSKIFGPEALSNAMIACNLPFSLLGLKWHRDKRASTQAEIKSTQTTLYARKIFPRESLRRIGEGRTGMSFVARVTKDFRNTLEHLFANEYHHVLVESLPPIGTRVVIRIAMWKRKHMSFKEFVEHHKRETAALAQVQREPPVKISKCGPCKASLHASEYVPKLYGFGIDTQYGVAVTCMEFIKGDEIRNIKHPSASLFFELQKLLSSMWSIGIDHNDMHYGNIIVTPQGKPYVIDFEFSVRAPQDAVKKFRDFLCLPGGVTMLNTAAQLFFTRHSEAILWQRTDGQLQFYNPSYRLLRLIWKRMNDTERRKVMQYKDKSLVCMWKNG